MLTPEEREKSGSFKQRIAGWWGRRQCGRGRHAPLIWKAKGSRDLDLVASTSWAAEMSVASGLYNFAKSLGWCPRCGTPVEWSSDSAPRKHQPGPAPRKQKPKAAPSRRSRKAAT